MLFDRDSGLSELFCMINKASLASVLRPPRLGILVCSIKPPRTQSSSQSTGGDIRRKWSLVGLIIALSCLHTNTHFSPVCEVTRRVDRRSKRAACKGAKVRLHSAQHRFQRKSLCALLSVGPRATIHPLIQVTLRGSPQSEESLGSFGLSCILQPNDGKPLI